MSEKLSIPDNLKPRFEQMMSMAPNELCEDEQIQKSILTYLKLGGVKLASHHIKVLTSQFCSGLDIAKPQNDENTTDGQDAEGQSKKGSADPKDTDGTRKEAKNEHSTSNKD